MSGGIDYSHEEMHNVGIGPGSPNSWEEYAFISPVMRELLDTVYTPAAYKSLHYHPNTFKLIYELPGMTFDQLKIFKQENKSFIPKLCNNDRIPYLPIFNAGKQLIKTNHRNILQSLIARNTEDVSVFVNMGFACESFMEWTTEPGERKGPPRLMNCGGADPRLRRIILKGYFPYFSNLSIALGEIMFFFTYAPTGRLALVTAPDDEREAAIDFIRKNGVMQHFDKICAQCGKTGEFGKCPCKAVRYCCDECHRAHWPLHREVCEWWAGKQSDA